MAKYGQIISAVNSGNDEEVVRLIKKMLEEGTDPLRIINNGLVKGMGIVGNRFRAGELFLPEILMAAKAMSEGIQLLKPLLTGVDIPTRGRVLIGTVKGDLHDIGKNLVAVMLESNGFDVMDLGVDVKSEEFIKAIKTYRPHIVGMSALLTTTMTAMKETIDIMKKEGLWEKVKVLVGGAPVTEEFAAKIGADGYAPDAAMAVELAVSMLT